MREWVEICRSQINYIQIIYKLFTDCLQIVYRFFLQIVSRLFTDFFTDCLRIPCTVLWAWEREKRAALDTLGIIGCLSHGL